MKIRNFDPYSISKMARQMMFEQLADKKNSCQKISDMELGDLFHLILKLIPKIYLLLSLKQIM